MLTRVRKTRCIGFLLLLFCCVTGIVNADVVDTYAILKEPVGDFSLLIEPLTFTVYRDAASSKANDWKISGEGTSQVHCFSVEGHNNDGFPVSLFCNVNDYDIQYIGIVPYSQNRRTSQYSRVRLAMDDGKYRSAIVPGKSSRDVIDFAGYINVTGQVTEKLNIKFYAQDFLVYQSVGSQYEFQFYGTERQDVPDVSSPEPTVLLIFVTGLFVLGTVTIKKRYKKVLCRS